MGKVLIQSVSAADSLLPERTQFRIGPTNFHSPRITASERVVARYTCDLRPPVEPARSHLRRCSSPVQQDRINEKRMAGLRAANPVICRMTTRGLSAIVPPQYDPHLLSIGVLNAPSRAPHPPFPASPSSISPVSAPGRPACGSSRTGAQAPVEFGWLGGLLLFLLLFWWEV